MRYSSTERIGVNAIERIVFEELSWIFREQPLVDVGIDAMIEIVNEGLPTCQFIASQIKSGTGNFHPKEKAWTYYASDIHYNYWLKSNVPVILIAYIPEKKEAYWISIEAQNFQRNKRQWRIDIPKRQLFNGTSKNRLLSLVNQFNSKETQAPWTLERIEKLNEQVKNISASTQPIELLNELMQQLSEAHNSANLKYRKLAEEGKNINSPQVKLVNGQLKAAILSFVVNGEKLVIEFSNLFAIGFDALTKIIEGCKELKLEPILIKILPSFLEFTKSASGSIQQIENIKPNITRLSKTIKDQSLKDALQSLNEVIDQMIREFTTAVKLTDNIIEIINTQ